MKRYFILLFVIPLAFVIGILYTKVQNLNIENDGNSLRGIPTPTVQNTPAPSVLPTGIQNVETPKEEKSAYDYFYDLGKDVSDNSNISVIDNKDGTIDVFNIIENKPDVVIKSAFEASTREWMLDFMSGVYTSPYKVRYVQMSVTWLYAEVSPTQVGLGINQANKVPEEDWTNTTPYDFCKWLGRVSTGKNDENPANSTYSNNFNCS